MAININLKDKKDVAVIIMVVALTLFLAKKIWTKQQVKLEAIKNNINTYQNTIDLAGQVNILLRETEKFKNLSWPMQESVGIMGKINELVTKYDIEISTFDPAGRKDTAHYIIQSMNLNINADYFSLVRFLSALENLNYLTKITTLKIYTVSQSAPDESGPLITAYISLDTYILKE